MKKNSQHIIYTIGHSTHSREIFLTMLKSFDIKILIDIRTLPGSRRFPQFDKENLEKYLAKSGIKYLHMAELGGRRKAKKDSKNNRWQNSSFRGYADYMETEEFANAIDKLEDIASYAPTVFMCAEAVWWKCHRSLVSDFLKAKGWEVEHIMGIEKSKEHTYTSPARIVNGQVRYFDDTLFD